MDAMMEQNNELVAVVKRNNLPDESGQSLLVRFHPFFSEAQSLIDRANEISVTDATQVTEMKQSRAMRLALRAVRINIEKTRKELKEESLRTGKAIDGMANILKYLIEPVEERLENAEKFAERAEAKRKEELRVERESFLKPFGVDTSFYDLGSMPEKSWKQLFEASRLEHEARQVAIREAEVKRIAAEQARIEKERKLREENEKLRRDAEKEKRLAEEKRIAAEKVRIEQERKLREENEKVRREAEKKLAAIKAEADRERAKREQLETQERERKLEKEKQAKAEAAAKRRSEKAPDIEKFSEFANSLRAMPVPVCKTEEGQKAAFRFRICLDDLADSAESTLSNSD